METIFMIALAITAWEIGLTLSRQINRRFACPAGARFEDRPMTTEEILARYEADANRPIEPPKKGGSFLLTICDALCGLQWILTFLMI